MGVARPPLSRYFSWVYAGFTRKLSWAAARCLDFQHQQSNDLLARPGQQDLTCHVCWDWLADTLGKNGFANPQIETQEAFLIRRAADFMSATVANEAHQLSQRKLGLLQLLHHLGQKFQVLWALRQ